MSIMSRDRTIEDIRKRLPVVTPDRRVDVVGVCRGILALVVEGRVPGVTHHIPDILRDVFLDLPPNAKKMLPIAPHSIE